MLNQCPEALGKSTDFRSAHAAAHAAAGALAAQVRASHAAPIAVVTRVVGSPALR